jgi:hypothetical protein
MGVADDKFMKQIKEASPRNIKLNIRQDELIKFSTDEIECTQTSMKEYLNGLIQAIQEKINNL